MCSKHFWYVRKTFSRCYDDLQLYGDDLVAKIWWFQRQPQGFLLGLRFTKMLLKCNHLFQCPDKEVVVPLWPCSEKTCTSLVNGNSTADTPVAISRDCASYTCTQYNRGLGNARHQGIVPEPSMQRLSRWPGSVMCTRYIEVYNQALSVERLVDDNRVCYPNEIHDLPWAKHKNLIRDELRAACVSEHVRLRRWQDRWAFGVAGGTYPSPHRIDFIS